MAQYSGKKYGNGRVLRMIGSGVFGPYKGLELRFDCTKSKLFGFGCIVRLQLSKLIL